MFASYTELPLQTEGGRGREGEWEREEDRGEGKKGRKGRREGGKEGEGIRKECVNVHNKDVGKHALPDILGWVDPSREYCHRRCPSAEAQQNQKHHQVEYLFRGLPSSLLLSPTATTQNNN